MSYKTISQNAKDLNFQPRVTAACAQEGAPGDPQAAMLQLIWPIVTATDIESAYESAVIGGNPDPGGDEAVVTDAMILAKVQALIPTLP